MLQFMRPSHTRHEATIHAAISYEGCIDKELYCASSINREREVESESEDAKDREQARKR